MIDLKEIKFKKESTLFEILNAFDKKIEGKSNPAGMALIVDESDKLIGAVTDGDVRRALLKHKSFKMNAADIMQENPIAFSEELSIKEILQELPSELEKRNRRATKFLKSIILVNSLNQPTRILDYHQLWEQRVATHRHIAIIGLGYVGLTLALALADEGYHVSGFDIDEKKVRQLNKGVSYVHEQGLPELLRENVGKNFTAHTDLPEDCDVFVISVGTPVSKSDTDDMPKPVMDYLSMSLETVGKALKYGNLVILRSTVPVGTCRDIVIPKLEEISGLKCGMDFHVSFAPERTAEGNAIKELRELPQIIGGFNEDSVEATVALFRELTPTIVRVNSLEAAEMAKLINNSFRDYVFAYSNYVANIASKFNLDINHVIRAANEGYPRNRVPYPSPGVGGPCLTKDPFIFSSVSSSVGLEDHTFINSRLVNEGMHFFVANRIEEALTECSKTLKNSKILICGLAFKGYPETGDLRNSSSIEITQILQNRGGKIFGYDPVADDNEIESFGINPVTIPEGFNGMDAILFLNNHKSFEKIDIFDMVRRNSTKPVIFDGWDQFHSDDILSVKECIYMGISHKKSSIK